MIRRLLAGVLLALGVAGPAEAQDRITLVLNWVPGSDHAPLYWAQQRGLYREVNINLTIENGRGSGFAAQRVGAGQAQFGIIDMPAALQVRGAGADLVAAMAIYVQSPYGLYWRRSSGITGPGDLRGRRLGAPPADAARVMWPMIARALNLGPNDVTWVNIAPEAKVASLQSGAIDATTHFYNVHYIYERVFGSDLGFVLTRDIGFNPYGNAFFANGAWLRANQDAARRFIRVTQRAYAECVQQPEACQQAVVGPSNTSLEDLRVSWDLVVRLMQDEPGANRSLGGFDPARVETTVAAVRDAFNVQGLQPAQVFTNDLLDPAIRLP
ncbi:ABC transporter substrate-binding protein [Muricoccus radiodurans]|uniref:ABC transporter substrate-binding protein n=1 Tax=Muricoccus radiodurans TaxID=2231721 RepID=UPI003CF5188D